LDTIAKSYNAYKIDNGNIQLFVLYLYYIVLICLHFLFDFLINFRFSSKAPLLPAANPSSPRPLRDVWESGHGTAGCVYTVTVTRVCLPVTFRGHLANSWLVKAPPCGERCPPSDRLPWASDESLTGFLCFRDADRCQRCRSVVLSSS